jgi:hypothetical protein
MTQTIPATAILGTGQSGLTLGYRVLNLDGTQYSAFTTAGVVESAAPGTYRVTGGVAAPDAGGYLVFGTAGVDLAEASVDPAPNAFVLPDSYAADGAQPTVGQALLGVYQFLMDRAVNGTTVTVYKPDGSTPAMTLTLNNAESPASITRTG